MSGGELFASTCGGAVWDAATRLERVQRCNDPAQLCAALALPGLQAAVRLAIEIRLRKLGRMQAGRAAERHL